MRDFSSSQGLMLHGTVWFFAGLYWPIFIEFYWRTVFCLHSGWDFEIPSPDTHKYLTTSKSTGCTKRSNTQPVKTMLKRTGCYWNSKRPKKIYDPEILAALRVFGVSAQPWYRVFGTWYSICSASTDCRRKTIQLFEVSRSTQCQRKRRKYKVIVGKRHILLAAAVLTVHTCSVSSWQWTPEPILPWSLSRSKITAKQ